MIQPYSRSNWELIYAQQKLAPLRPEYPYYEPIEDIKVTCNTAIASMGAYNPHARNDWQLGAWCYNTLPTSPSDSSALQRLQLGDRLAVPLNQLATYNLSDLADPPYSLLFKVPNWHRDFYLEVWAYIGE